PAWQSLTATCAGNDRLAQPQAAKHSCLTGLSWLSATPENGRSADAREQAGRGVARNDPDAAGRDRRCPARHDEDCLTPDIALCGVETCRCGRDARAGSVSWGGSMKRQLTVALLATGTAATIWAAPASAAAVTSGSESFHGMIVKGRTGAVITSV